MFSNTSIWILSLVSGFIMETLTREPVLITLTAAMTSLTGLISASVSGAAADARDRRLIILLAKGILLASALFLCLVSLAGALTPATLLIGLAGVGIASGTSSPSWWSTVSSLVPPRLVPVALSIDSFQWNIGQVLGPILGGYILHSVKATVLFLVCSVLIAPLFGFLVVWRGRNELGLSTPGAAAAEKIAGAISAGWRYFYYTPGLRSIAARTILYVAPAAALSSLLPLLATRYLHASAFTYGLYLALGGVGAMLAALLLPRLHGALHLDVLVAFATTANLGAVALIAIFPVPFVAIPVLIVAGGTWVWVTTVLTIATRDSAPEWVRTRSLAIFYLMLQAPYALGGIGFGIVDTFLPLRVTLLVDAALFLPGLLLIPRYGLPVVDGTDLQLTVRPALVAGDHVDLEDGPVMILVEYQLAEQDVDEFLSSMAQLRLVRRRLGAFRWGVYEDVTQHGLLVETFLVSSWQQYLRQREHYTNADAAIEERVRSFHIGPREPHVTRLVHPDTVEAARARSSWRREMSRLISDPYLDPEHTMDVLGPVTHPLLAAERLAGHHRRRGIADGEEGLEANPSRPGGEADSSTPGWSATNEPEAGLAPLSNGPQPSGTIRPRADEDQEREDHLEE